MGEQLARAVTLKKAQSSLERAREFLGHGCTVGGRHTLAALVRAGTAWNRGAPLPKTAILSALVERFGAGLEAWPLAPVAGRVAASDWVRLAKPVELLPQWLASGELVEDEHAVSSREHLREGFRVWARARSEGNGVGVAAFGDAIAESRWKGRRCGRNGEVAYLGVRLASDPPAKAPKDDAYPALGKWDAHDYVLERTDWPLARRAILGALVKAMDPSWRAPLRAGRCYGAPVFRREMRELEKLGLLVKRGKTADLRPLGELLMCESFGSEASEAA